jgi:hypothetical protein
MSILANRKPERKPRRKPARTIKVIVGFNAEGLNAVIRIAAGKEAADYFVSRIFSDFGKGYRLEKINDPADTIYHVNLAADGTRTCDCPGHNWTGHCKHADGLAALVRAGKL